MAPELFDGFGVVLLPSAGVTFIDLDGVRDPDTGALAPWAVRMVAKMDSWTELSVSGTGLHIFCVRPAAGPRPRQLPRRRSGPQGRGV